MKFFLQMVYGNSDQYYGGGGPGLPFQGVCQGNDAGPAIWLVTSTVLMNMVQSNGYQILFSSLISHQATDLLRLLYIGDCDLLALDDNGCHPCSAIGNLQHNIFLWQGGLAVTGGSSLVKNLCGAFWQCTPRDIGGHSTLSVPFQPHYCPGFNAQPSTYPTGQPPWRHCSGWGASGFIGDTKTRSDGSPSQNQCMGTSAS